MLVRKLKEEIPGLLFAHVVVAQPIVNTPPPPPPPPSAVVTTSAATAAAASASASAGIKSVGDEKRAEVDEIVLGGSHAELFDAVAEMHKKKNSLSALGSLARVTNAFPKYCEHRIEFHAHKLVDLCKEMKVEMKPKSQYEKQAPKAFLESLEQSEVGMTAPTEMQLNILSQKILEEYIKIILRESYFEMVDMMTGELRPEIQVIIQQHLLLQKFGGEEGFVNNLKIAAVTSLFVNQYIMEIVKQLNEMQDISKMDKYSFGVFSIVLHQFTSLSMKKEYIDTLMKGVQDEMIMFVYADAYVKKHDHDKGDLQRIADFFKDANIFHGTVSTIFSDRSKGNQLFEYMGKIFPFYGIQVADKVKSGEYLKSKEDFASAIKLLEKLHDYDTCYRLLYPKDNNWHLKPLAKKKEDIEAAKKEPVFTQVYQYHVAQIPKPKAADAPVSAQTAAAPKNPMALLPAAGPPPGHSMANAIVVAAPDTSAPPPSPKKPSSPPTA